MAVYYKWIKGCATNANLGNGLWSYLKWGEGTSGTSVNNLPTLYTSDGKVDEPSNSLGYILTNNATDVNIEQKWQFKNGINLIGPGIKWSSTSNSSDASLEIKPNQSNKYFRMIASHELCILSGGDIALGMKPDTDLDFRCVNITPPSENRKWDGAKTKILSDLYLGGTLKGTEDYIAYFPRSGDSIIIKSDLKIENFLKTTKHIHSDSYCEAEYFNATSDIRAKENIKPATYNALELIKKLQIYTYNYINKPESVTGIMAQELLEAQPKELDLVSNINASGENGDYMSIKNDKLMFVLMKAIQEQQEKIEALEYELQCLKNN